MSLLSRWVTSTDQPVDGADLGPDGLLTEATVRSWAEAAVQSYVDLCPALTEREADGARLQRRFGRQPDPARLGRPELVIVTASATEFRPTEFVVSVRLRPTGGDEHAPIDLTCVVALENAAGAPLELGTVVRDELIALQHAAQYMN